MQLSTELTQLLTAALRSRADDVSQLTEITGTSAEEARGGVETLRHLGYLDLNDDAISYRRPEIPVTEAARDTLAAVVDTLTRNVSELHTTLGALPALLQAWDDGATEDRTISADVIHGPTAAMEAWMHHFARDTPRHCDLSIPDLRRVLEAPREHRIADWASTAMGELQVRLLTSHADAANPALRPALQRMQERGTEIRWHPQPPSFFWVSDATIAGLPFHWGEVWPKSVVTIRTTPIVEVVAAAFDGAWRAATPLEDDRRSWEPMLILMNEGMTMDAAASKLGMAQRTARRRVADAMTHYGVSSQFALGAAWARSRGPELRS